MKRIIICAYRKWNIEMVKERFSGLSLDIRLISQKDALDKTELKEYKPDIIFFLDWSWKVPAEIIDNYLCVGFHVAPLPDFRGGSPLQNQIIRGVKQTKLTAYRMDHGIDTGDIMLQRPLSLEGHLRDIISRITDLEAEMISEIVNGRYQYRPQKGKGSYFKRRTPDQSKVTDEDLKKPLEHLYNMIRMLEDPYPNAFIDIGNTRILFKEADLDMSKEEIIALVKVVKIRRE